jgi:ferredoxin-thioredoxin reductase catalytic subunit
MIEERISEFVNEYGLTAEGRKKLRIIESLKRNYDKYGHAYCPCKIEKSSDNICPCKEYRDGGECICGLHLPHEMYDNTK